MIWRNCLHGYHLDRKIRLSNDSKHESLYSWSLQEFDESGKQIGSDQIPWPWSLWCTANELSHNKSITNEYNDDETSISETETITAKLYPGNWRNGCLEDGTSYSMFGTDRKIKEFSLQIQALKEESQEDDDSLDNLLELDEAEKQKQREERKKERCCVWGCVSYTAEVDFRDETQEDIICIYIYLKPERFNRIVKAVNERQVDGLLLRLDRVSGFYSEWSPAISTSRVKVLTASSNDHNVIVPDNCNINPPRLGHVGSFWISFAQRLDLSKEVKRAEGALLNDLDKEADEFDDEYGVRQQPKLAAGDLLVAQLKRNEIVLNKLRRAVWFLFGALVLLLIIIAS